MAGMVYTSIDSEKLTTAELCNGTLPSGFSTSIWKAGSNSYSDANVYPIDDEFAIKRNCVYPSIIGIGEPAYGGTSYYNVGTAESPDWKQCTFIRTIDDLKNVKNKIPEHVGFAFGSYSSFSRAVFQPFSTPGKTPVFHQFFQQFFSPRGSMFPTPGKRP